MATVQQAAAGLEVGVLMEFLELDFTQFGGGFFRAYNSLLTTAPLGVITFLGEEWNPIPFKSEGWALDGAGGTPRPNVTISDANALLLTAMFAYDDAVGAPVYRYKSTLDGYDEGSYYGPEIWLVNRIVQADGMVLKFELAAPFDQIRKKVPNKNMFRSEYPGLQR